MKKITTAGAAGAAFMANFGSNLEAAVDRQNLFSSPSALKITDVKPAYMRGHGTHMFVKIETNQGITGYGEAMDAVSGSYYLVKNFIRSYLVNKNPLNINMLFDGLRQRGFFHGSQSGMFVSVITAIDFALWDLVGKALEMPVYQLLGGKYRDKIRIYCDTASSSEEPENMAESALDVKKLGFTAIKFDCDWAGDPAKYDLWNWTPNNAEVDRMDAQFSAVRKAIGPHMDLCVDAHGRYDYPGAFAIAKMFEKHRLMWFEEPMKVENMESLAALTRETSTPICVGENHYLAHEFRKLLELKACDIVMPDLHKAGGIGEGQRIGNLAFLYNVPVAPHNVASPFGTMGACHCCASFPNFLTLEWHWISRWDRWNELIEEAPLIQNGYITVSNKPGIGVTLIEDAIKKTAIPNVPFFE